MNLRSTGKISIQSFIRGLNPVPNEYFRGNKYWLNLLFGPVQNESPQRYVLTAYRPHLGSYNLVMDAGKTTYKATISIHGAIVSFTRTGCKTILLLAFYSATEIQVMSIWMCLKQ